MAFCSSDNRLHGFDELQAEIDSEDVTDEEVVFTVHLVRPCEGCGDEQATYDMELQVEIDHECPEGEHEETEEDRTFEVESSDVSTVDEYETKDRHGKAIRNPRYQRHLLGAEVTATIKCSRCGESFEASASDTVTASSFDDQGTH